jgi:hypothetical protein
LFNVVAAAKQRLQNIVGNQVNVTTLTQAQALNQILLWQAKFCTYKSTTFGDYDAL